MTAVRTVTAEPPHDPEPFEDEPFAPVYDYVPLGPWRNAGGDDPDEWLPNPRYPDWRVFGPPGTAELQRRMFFDPYAAGPDHRTLHGAHLRSGGDRCWSCGIHCGLLAADNLEETRKT